MVTHRQDSDAPRGTVIEQYPEQGEVLENGGTVDLTLSDQPLMRDVPNVLGKTLEETRQRLKILTKTNDGFRLAEEDLRLRGPGDFFGVRQHGLPGLRVADLGCDAQLLQSAQKSAEALLADDPELAHSPALRDRVAELFARNAETMN